MKRRLLLGTVLMAAGVSQGGAATAPMPWMNRQLSADARADLVVKAATPQELQGLINGEILFLMPPKDRPAGVTPGAGYNGGIPRLGIPPLVESDASLGVANLSGMLRPHDVATAMPSSLAVAASFDTSIAREGGAMIGSEARAKGFNVLLAGGMNLARDPRGGRSFEYAGEDPLLSGRITGAQIAGVQSNNIVSTMKHFGLNDQETGRNVYSVEMPRSQMRESDLLAFRIAIEEGKPGSVMCAYNLVEAVHACENPFLLTKVLRNDWQWPGWVMSDWGAVYSSEALVAGLDQQSAGKLDQKPWFGTELTAKIAAGQIPQQAVTTAARRILRTMFAHGLVDQPAKGGEAIDYNAHAIVARRAADAGIVLLKNDTGVLPIASSAKTIVLIGGHADVGVIAGGGSSQVMPVGGPALSLKVPGEGMLAGISRIIYDPSSPLAALKAALPNAQISFVDGSDPAAAAAAAKQADLAIVFATKTSTEGADAKDLSLPDGQDDLISAVASATPHTVVVLETGNPVDMPWHGSVGAILEAWFSGQKGGEAIADVLVGRYNPSGRLPMTFPASLDRVPNPKLAGIGLPIDPSRRGPMGSKGTDPIPFKVQYPEGADVGYRWYAAKHLTPLFPFGHGLSYSRFEYSGLKVSGGSKLVASFTVTNRSAVAGTDVPQIYVRSADGAKRLAGWGRVTLQPGEARQVTVTAEPRILAHWDETRQRYVIDAGRYEVELAHSATDVALSEATRLTTISLAP